MGRRFSIKRRMTMKIAFTFPGQGTQFVGMGKDIYNNFAEARAVYEQANEIMKLNISDLCFNGPDSELVKTENQQPTIHTTEIAILRSLEKLGVKPDITAGFSLGEYAALVCTGALKFEDSVKLVKKRGIFMQTSVPLGIGKMIAISGLEKSKVFEIVEEASKVDTIECSNFNCPGQIIVSGYNAAVDKAADLANKAGARKVTYLKVSVPFHTSLLVESGKRLREELDLIKVEKPKYDFITNVTGKLVNKDDDIRELLELHVSKAVLWEDTIDEMVSNDVDIYVELGPSGSLTRFNKKTLEKHGKEALCFHIQDSEGIKRFADYLSKERMMI